MPQKATRPESPAERSEQSVQAPSRARRVRRCRACKRPVSPAALMSGECVDCAGLVPLPLRGEGGRFLSFGAPQNGGGR